ncbi:hypothetical protein ACF09C_08305 [Streptomyces sp. NPDC014870]|uniref:hypothetical protein n=1 Tax=Streptomyces sp. NPDC014870 TaxID=3364925 RepID=UPI003700910A
MSAAISSSSLTSPPMKALICSWKEARSSQGNPEDLVRDRVYPGTVWAVGDAEGTTASGACSR